MFTCEDTIVSLILSMIQFIILFAIGVNLLDTICIFFGVNLKDSDEPKESVRLSTTFLGWKELNERK